MLDPTLQHCLLVQGYWVKASWGFPKGKINQEEAQVDCAIREVLEETGFDIKGLIDEKRFLEYRLNEQVSRLYIVPDIPMDTKFHALTRKEIKSFSWFRVDWLPGHKKDMICKQQYNLMPNAFFMVIPFVKNLRQWINVRLNAGVSPLIFSAGGSGLPTSPGAANRFGSRSSLTPGGAAVVDTLRSSVERRKQKQASFQVFPASTESHDYCSSPREDFPGMTSKGQSSGDVKLRTKSESPPHRVTTAQTAKDASPRPLNKKNTHASNKSIPTSSSPIKVFTAKPTKQIKIAKRENNMVEAPDEIGQKTPARKTPQKPEQRGDESCNTVFNQNYSSRAVTNVQFMPDDFICSAWKDFRLDIDAVLLSMFPNMKQPTS